MHQALPFVASADAIEPFYTTACNGGIRINLVTTSRSRPHTLRKCSDFGPMFNGLNGVSICSLALCQLTIVESRTVWLMDCCAVHDCFHLVVFCSSLAGNAPIASTGVEHLQCRQPRH